MKAVSAQVFQFRPNFLSIVRLRVCSLHMYDQTYSPPNIQLFESVKSAFVRSTRTLRLPFVRVRFNVLGSKPAFVPGPLTLDLPVLPDIALLRLLAPGSRVWGLETTLLFRLARG